MSAVRSPNKFELSNRDANLDYCRCCGISAAEEAIARFAPLKFVAVA